MDKAWGMLNKLFDEILIKLEDKWDTKDIDDIRSFYKAHEKDLKDELNLQHDKPSTPEHPDLKLIACIINEKWNMRYLLSDDAHFVGYIPELHDNFKIRIISMKDLRQIMLQWRWVCL